MKTCAVFGGRHYLDRKFVRSSLDVVFKTFPSLTTIVHGATGWDAGREETCTVERLIGACRWADEWARENGVSTVRVPADWTRLKSAAGIVRSEKMIDDQDTRDCLCVAYSGSSGTDHECEYAKKKCFHIIDLRNWPGMTIVSFREKNSFLSNFYPCEIVYCEKTYSTVEHAYQSKKCVDEDEAERVRSCPTPGAAKKMSRSIVVRDDWRDVKYDVMLELLRLKFSLGSDLSKLLLDTRDFDLVEGNEWGDVDWGVCKGVGENNLGKLLMRVRDELQVSQVSL